MAIEKFHVLDSSGLYTAALEIFQLVEDTYVRRTTYESDLSSLNERLILLEMFDTYTCEIDPVTGNLVFIVPDDASPTMSIDSNGDLILTSYDSTVDKALECYSFNIDANGVLRLTIDTSQS